MSFGLRLVTGICWAMGLSPAALTAQVFEASILPAADEKYRSAEFRLWLPESAKQVRAIVIRQHDCGRSGLEHPYDVQFRALAKKWNAAILGTHFTPQDDCADWSNPAHGTERALLAALDKIAAESQHPELARAPWVLWGHAGGAEWAMRLTYRLPERVVCVFARSGAISEDSAAARGVPILFAYGEQEKTGRDAKVHARVTEAIATARPKGALWAPAVDPKSGRQCANARQLAAVFFDEVLALRLSGSVVAGETPQLKAIDPASGWLASLSSFDAAAAADFRGDKTQAAWLPNERIAKAWQQYCRYGEVPDPTPPPAPTSITAMLEGDGVRLTWQADADLESGVRSYFIYRDGVRIGKLGGTVSDTNREGLYQTWNAGDEPEARPAELTFFDPTGTSGSRYQIAVQNQSGLDSEKNVPVRVGK